MKTLQAGIAIVLLFMFFMANTAFAQCGRVPLNEGLAAMASDSEVTVTQVDVAWESAQSYNPQYYYEFKPAGITPTDGFIFYPGADVDERAYAVTARAIARAGFLVALVPMPDCLAFYGIGRADAVIANNPGIDTWSIGGHSFGGVCAAWYINGTYTHNSKINGIVFWASYPADSLAAKPIKAISLWGTNDNLTTEQHINDSKINLPADTYYQAIKGGNHTQFGWYGLTSDDYGYLSVGSQGQVDNLADISRQTQDDLLCSYTVSFLDSLTLDSDNIPAAVDEVTAEDGSIWEKVSLPGFVDINNTDIVALTPYKGNLYALTRNDASGFELWKTDPAQGWLRIHVQGFTDQNDYYGYLQHPDLPDNPFVYLEPSERYNPNMNIWADMIEFQGRLYVAVSTGYQGSALFGSRGALIWRTDGVAWEPVIGGHDPVAQGTLSAISSCDDNDGSTTAVFNDSTQSWEIDSLTGCVIEVAAEFTSTTPGVSGIVPAKRVFKIISNTANALTVQQSEKANVNQSTRCDEYLAGGGDIGRPRNNMPRVVTGAAYTISCGDHAQGFGDPWNKSIIDFEILNDVLYASIGLNYEKGARVMKTSDGLTWTADSPYSFDNIHGKDWHDGTDLVTCPDGGLTTRAQTPVSSSATKMVKTSVTGQETLLIGGTGTAGCNGRGARIYRRDGDQVWTPIVDVLVDENTTGSNENGFGYDSGGNFFFSAFQAWSWLEYDNQLLVGVAKLEAGGMVYSTPDAAEEDGAWTLSMGGVDNAVPDDVSPNPALNGFGDVLNTGVFLHSYNNAVYAGTLVTNQSLAYDNPLNGADLWKGTADGGSVNWSRIEGGGFGDPTVLQFQSFADYATDMYMVASTVNSSNFRGQEPADYTGVVVYRFAEEAPECQDAGDCPEGYECVDGTCEIIDDPPVIEDGPFLAAGSWPVLPTDSDNPMLLTQNYSVLWTFSDDYARCPEGLCTHTAEYQALGQSTWTPLAVTGAQGYAYADLPVESLQNATTYAFRFSVIDCVSQQTQSQTYYFRVAVTDAPPVLGDGPFLAAGTWPLLSTSVSKAFVLDQDYDVVWTFSDDYASCPTGACTHRARYRKVAAEEWTWIPVSTDPSGELYAFATLPVASSAMDAGTYQFHFEVLDCLNQRTKAEKGYYFKVE